VQVRLALLADAANVSREGKLNVLGVFDTLHARQFPTAHPHMALVLRLEAAAGEAAGPHAMEVEVVAPDGTVVLRVPGTLTLAGFAGGDRIAFDHVLSFANMQFAGPGRYTIRIALDGVVAATLPLRVERLPVAH
jgi:hypothetical protein